MFLRQGNEGRRNDARLQERQVQRIIPTLIDRGFITRNVGKGRSASKYVVQVAFIKELIRKGDIETPQEEEKEEAAVPDSGDTGLLNSQLKRKNRALVVET